MVFKSGPILLGQSPRDVNRRHEIFAWLPRDVNRRHEIFAWSPRDVNRKHEIFAWSPRDVNTTHEIFAAPMASHWPTSVLLLRCNMRHKL